MKEIPIDSQIIDYSSYLKVVAIKLTANQEQADDLVQDNIYRALVNQEKFLGGNLKAWLTTIMKNLFINGIRTSKRRQNLTTTSNHDFVMESVSNSTFNQGDSKIMMKEMEQEIDRLHPDLRTPFMMRYEGYKYEEIAQRLDAPIGTIKSRIHIARKNLIRKLGRMYGSTFLSELAA